MLFLDSGRSSAGFCSACKLRVSNSGSFVTSFVSALKLCIVFIRVCGLLTGFLFQNHVLYTQQQLSTLFKVAFYLIDSYARTAQWSLVLGELLRRCEQRSAVVTLLVLMDVVLSISTRDQPQPR